MLIWESMPQSTAYQHEEGRGLTASTLLFALIHRSAWKRNSRKFARIAPNKSPRRVSTRGS
jgi:hypothetical protein